MAEITSTQNIICLLPESLDKYEEMCYCSNLSLPVQERGKGNVQRLKASSGVSGAVKVNYWTLTHNAFPV